MGTPPILVVAAPGTGTYSPDFIRGSTAFLFSFLDWPVSNIDVGPTFAPFRQLTLDNGQFPPAVPRMGAQVIAPGDVTGNGHVDLVLLEDTAVGMEFGNVLVFPGPLTGPDVPVERGYASPDTLTLIIPGTTQGVPCGDMNADGIEDLCLDSGILFGPLSSSSGVDISWEPGTQPIPNALPLEEVGLLMWDSVGQQMGIIEGVEGSVPAALVSATPVSSSPTAWATSRSSDALTVLYGTEQDGSHQVTAIQIGGLAPLFVLDVDVALTALAYVDVDGDGIRDVVAGGADSKVRLYDGERALLGDTCALGVLDVPGVETGLGRTILAAELEGGGAPELIIGAPDEDRTSGVPGIHGSAYLLKLPLEAP